MTIGKRELSAMLLSAAELFTENAAYLSEIDSRFGDGDHGITIGKIAGAIRSAVKSWGAESIHDFFEDLGSTVMAVNGGSAGPLYGTLLGGLGVPFGAETVLSAQDVQKMLASALSEMQEITNAHIGDKTMMDALIPAVNAAQSTKGDIPEILRAAADAAKAGAQASEGFVAKFGRARSYKNETIGTPDAGAVSTALFFEGFAAGL